MLEWSNAQGRIGGGEGTIHHRETTTTTYIHNNNIMLVFPYPICNTKNTKHKIIVEWGALLLKLSSNCNDGVMITFIIIIIIHQCMCIHHL